MDVRLLVRDSTVHALRVLTAAGVLLSAAVHLDLYLQGFRTVAVIGPLFLANVVGGLLLGIAVLRWRHLIPAFLSAGYGAVTVIAYWISVVWGLFGVRETTSGWFEILAEVAEYVAVLAGLAVTGILLAERRRNATHRPLATPRSSVR